MICSVVRARRSRTAKSRCGSDVRRGTRVHTYYMYVMTRRQSERLNKNERAAVRWKTTALDVVKYKLLTATGFNGVFTRALCVYKTNE